MTEVERLAGNRSLPAARAALDVAALRRSKVEPMVRGLFARAEQDTVLATLERATVVLSRDNVEKVLLAAEYLSSA